jgi:hypothetical protein
MEEGTPVRPAGLLEAEHLAHAYPPLRFNDRGGLITCRAWPSAAGDVARSTGNLKLAMEYIGDTDIRRAREYIQVRPDHLKEAASVMDREHPDRTQTVPEPGGGSEAGLELVGTGGPTKLPRQDSNLRPAG